MLLFLVTGPESLCHSPPFFAVIVTCIISISGLVYCPLVCSFPGRSNDPFSISYITGSAFCILFHKCTSLKAGCLGLCTVCSNSVILMLPFTSTVYRGFSCLSSLLSTLSCPYFYFLIKLFILRLS